MGEQKLTYLAGYLLMWPTVDDITLVYLGCFHSTTTPFPRTGPVPRRTQHPASPGLRKHREAQAPCGSSPRTAPAPGSPLTSPLTPTAHQFPHSCDFCSFPIFFQVAALEAMVCGPSVNYLGLKTLAVGGDRRLCDRAWRGLRALGAPLQVPPLGSPTPPHPSTPLPRSPQRL